MDPLIHNLKSTTFFGRRFTRREISDIQETIALFPAQSRNELAKTICEHLNWYTPRGDYRKDAALRVLEQLEELGILTLPPKRNTIPGRRSSIVKTTASDPQEEISCPLSELEPLSLQVADTDDDKRLWRELVDRHHYLGCPRPFGPSLYWFVVDSRGRKLGCLLFEAGSRQLPARDNLIGWNTRQREQRLHLVVQNSRFLLLPWVRVRNLASRTLGMATSRLADEWERRHECRPVLIETFVDPTRFDGASYKAANWERIGMTAGKKSGQGAKPPKDIHVQPLIPDYRDILKGTVKPKRAKPKPAGVARNRNLADMWKSILSDLSGLARDYDRKWIRRQRVLNSLLVILFVFRLALTPKTRGYATILAELWEQCRKLGIPLPQPRPVSQSSIAKARRKVNPDLFHDVHRIIIGHGGEGPGWKGHRILAIDGTKMNLPRPLVDKGYRTPNEGAHYPQGLVSCLYRTGDGVPITFSLSSHACERTAAKGHFKVLEEGDVVIMDRGYFSFGMLHDLHRRGVHPVFRLQAGSGKAFEGFMDGDGVETVVAATFGKDVRRQLQKRWPNERPEPIPVRLVRITPGETDIVLATTLLDTTTYTATDIGDLYHQRWSIEELYKISKGTIGVDDFHGQNEWNVRQELYAHFNLIAMTRLFTGTGNDLLAERHEDNGERQATNFSHALAVVAANLEELLLAHAGMVVRVVHRMAGEILRIRQRVRPDRAYPRVSMKPRKKWQKRGEYATG